MGLAATHNLVLTLPKQIERDPPTLPLPALPETAEFPSSWSTLYRDVRILHTMASEEAPSLDAIATGRQGRNNPNNAGPPAEAPIAADTPVDDEVAAAGAVDDQQDSRSTSSASSPLPAEYEESDFYANCNDSQSSLGVPNLQDMQVTDEYECLPPVQRLPNEILICIFCKLSASTDLRNVMLTCKRWSRNAVDLLWHRPACTTWDKHGLICRTLSLEQPYYRYADFVKRLNLAQLSDKVSDGSVMPLAICNRVERLTLTGCKELTDRGLIALVTNSSHLMALDISGDVEVTEESVKVMAANCKRIQGLNISNCVKISSESLVQLAENCRYLKRLKLNDCSQITDDAVSAFAQNCPNILEIDLQQCKQVGNAPVTSLMVKGQSLRELRLANCELVDDSAFLSLPSGQTYEHLRILDLTSCVRVTDRAVEKIISAAPRLRNVVLAKCRNITDQAVFAIAGLGKNLHYIHLGHCANLTDEAVKRLVYHCNRIRYIDLGCCTNLTDESVTRLAVLPKLKRIGLVKCNSITDTSVYALAKANQRYRDRRRDVEGRCLEHYSSGSSLERVHLSYCTQLSLKSIIKLLNSCPRLTHLSLTGVQAFLRQDLEQFCRDAPSDFTDHQRNVFCVFSGQGVSSLRRHLNTDAAFAHLRDSTPPGHGRRQQTPVDLGFGPGPFANHHHQSGPDAGLDEQERDVIDDDDLDGSEMVIDGPPISQAAPAQGVDGASLDAVAVVPNMIPPTPPPPPENPWNSSAHPWQHDSSQYPEGPAHVGSQRSGPSDGDAMDFVPPAAIPRQSASTAPVGLTNGAGPSTANMNATSGHSSAIGHHAPPVPRSRNDNGGSSRSSPDPS